jgi:hypothetical protein
MVPWLTNKPKGSPCYSSLPCDPPKPDQSNPHMLFCFLKISSNVIHRSMPGSSKWSFCSSFMSECTHNSFPHACYVPHIYHHCLIHQTIFCEQYRLWTCSQYSLLHSYVTLPLHPQISLSTPISNTRSLWSSLILSDRVSHPYKTSCMVTVLCIWIVIFFGSKLDSRWFCTKW